VLSNIEQSQRSGSTGTVALLHSLDGPAQPYFSAKKLHLTIGHCGYAIESSLFEAHLADLHSDTRALLCSRSTGEVVALTEKHHAEARVEATRLRRMGANRLVADSFGESRWMGVIENTRG
jgi:protein phosphatase PTC6